MVYLYRDKGDQGDGRQIDATGSLNAQIQEALYPSMYIDKGTTFAGLYESMINNVGNGQRRRLALADHLCDQGILCYWRSSVWHRLVHYQRQCFQCFRRRSHMARSCTHCV